MSDEVLKQNVLEEAPVVEESQPSLTIQTTLKKGDRLLTTEDIMKEQNPHNEVILDEQSFTVPETGVEGILYTNRNPDPTKKGILGVITPGFDGRIKDDHGRFGNQPYGFARILGAAGLERIVALPWSYSTSEDKERAYSYSTSRLTDELEMALQLINPSEDTRLLIMTRSFGTQIPANLAARIRRGDSRLKTKIAGLILCAPTNYHDASEGSTYQTVVSQTVKERSERTQNPATKARITSNHFYDETLQGLSTAPLCVIQGADDELDLKLDTDALYRALPEAQPKLFATMSNTKHSIGEPKQKAVLAVTALTFIENVL